MKEKVESQKVETRTGGDAPSEEIAVETNRALPLDSVHRGAGAHMTERDGWSVPAHYNDAQAEYWAVRAQQGAGVFDLSMRGRVEVSGAEAVQFLNGLVTNDFKTLADGAWMHAAFPNVQGRLLASVRVIRQGVAFLFDTEAATHAAVLKTLERFTLAGDFHVRDLTHETATLSVQGARAARIIAAVCGEQAAGVERGRVASAQLAQRRVTLIRATHTAEDGFDLFTDAGDAESLWKALLEAGASPVRGGRRRHQALTSCASASSRTSTRRSMSERHGSRSIRRGGAP